MPGQRCGYGGPGGARDPADLLPGRLLVHLDCCWLACMRPDALGPGLRAELLHVLMLPDFERADGSESSGATQKSCAFAELLIDCEGDRTLRAVLVGMLREGDRNA
jgi:hypothetical protein